MSVRSERAIIFCIGAVQFVNILDFVIVMPLGPDFAGALGIPMSQLGYVGGSYTAAASISGIAGAFFLDRFDRRNALTVAMLGLVVGTISGAFARGLWSLLAARIVAGAFGGPATSLAYAIIADVIPSERRGKAVGAVMGAFSVASVLGVPAGLELARQGGWKLPFFAVAAIGAVLTGFSAAFLPSMTGHLEGHEKDDVVAALKAMVRSDIVLSLFMTFMVMAAGFVLIPNISPYVLGNLHYPRARLGLLYLAGGSVSFFTMRLVGVLVDRLGSAKVGTFGTVLLAVVVYAGFVQSPPSISVMAIFILFMFSMSFRNVSYNTLTTKVPRPDERARFGSVQSAVQHLASALGAFASSQMLVDGPEGTLIGVDRVAWVTIGLALSLPPLLVAVEKRVQKAA